MLYVVSHLSDPLTDLVKNDPVRPHIPVEQRIGKNSQIWVLKDDQDQPVSVVCVSLQDFIPINEEELFQCPSGIHSVIVLYTIWSMNRGGGQQLVTAALDHVKSNWPTVSRLVTLSPPTEMARRFHLKNGAFEMQTNLTTINYEYNL